MAASISTTNPQFLYCFRLISLPNHSKLHRHKPTRQLQATSLRARCSLPDTTTTSTTTTTTTTADVDVASDSSLLVKKRAADVSPDLKGTPIFLVGMKSSVKTNLGKFLAEALRYYYFDSDSLVEEAYGGEAAAKSVRENDEKGFRDSETEVLKQLSSMGRLVVCAGDGAVQSSNNLALLRHGISIWVDIPLDIIANEIKQDKTKPSSSDMSTETYQEDQVLTQLRTTYEEMRGRYATADATISLLKLAGRLGYEEMDSLSTEDITLEVLREIERLTRVKKMMEEAGRPF